MSIWYNCINRFMIRRVLAAKDVWHARRGIVFSGFMKIFLPLIVVIPGLLMAASTRVALPVILVFFPARLQRPQPTRAAGLRWDRGAPP